MVKKLLVAVMLLLPGLVLAQEPKRVNVASSPAARYQIIQASYGSGFSVSSEKDQNETTVIILLDSQTGQTWRYYDVTVDGEWKMGWLPLSELQYKGQNQNKEAKE